MTLPRRREKPRSPDWYTMRFTETPGKVACACVTCARPMWLPPSKVEMYKRCGPVCSAIARAAAKEERKRKCATCGRDFYPRAVQLRNGTGRFCSQKCNTAGVAALFTEEAQKLGRQRYRELSASGQVKRYRGAEHPKWKGGKEAGQRRRTESGKTAAELRAYRKANPDKIREFAQRRESRKVGCLPRGTVKRIGAAQKWKCGICRKGIKRGYHVDHVKPLSLGGEHLPANIQLLCPTCNVRKAAKDPIDYMQSLGRLL